MASAAVHDAKPRVTIAEQVIIALQEICGISAEVDPHPVTPTRALTTGLLLCSHEVSVVV
jgi:hypothetical protein